MKKNQSKRLTEQHEKSQGVVGIFGAEAQQHDADVSKNSHIVKKVLEKEFPMLTFRYRKEVSKK